MSGNWKQYFHQAHLYRETLERLAQMRYPNSMDTNQKLETERRKKILAFWSAHGLAATKDAFSVSRSTLFA